MTGRYQQHTGIYTAGEGGSGLPLGETIFPQYLKPAGYVSAAFGKWHLGLTKEYSPVARGFDEFYGFLGRGAHDYFDLANPKSPIYRNFDPVKDHGYLTDRLTEEAVKFIDQNKDRPFFMYLAYNAVHHPQEAPQADIDRYAKAFPDIGRDRQILMAMLYHLDQGIGTVVKKLKDENLFDNTLIFFLSDNGGARAMDANNAPLRGFKQQDYEGGVRVPFAISWPDRIKGGRVLSTPVISLDILATSLAAAGIPPPKGKPLEGDNLLPLLTSGKPLPPRNLYWCTGSDDGWWSVLSGDYKLISYKGRLELYNLAKDLGEKDDLVTSMPEEVQELTRLHETWLGEMAKPMHSVAKEWTPEAARQLRSKAGRKAERKRNRKSETQEED